MQNNRFILDWNQMSIPNEMLNSVLTALFALITVMALHDSLEGIAVRATNELDTDTLQSLLLLRSHGSMSRLYSLFHGDPLFCGQYHGSRCSCAQDYIQDHPPGCVVRQLRQPVSRRRLTKTALLRCAILIIEVGVLFLATTGRHRYPLENGKFALTPISSGFGKEVKVRKDCPQEKTNCLGCHAVLTDTSPQMNRRTQLTVCTRLHQPIKALEETKLRHVRGGFDTYRLYIHLSGDKVTFADTSATKKGAEMYAYWLVEEKLQEGVVPTVEDGNEYRMSRYFNVSDEEIAGWREKLDKKLKGMLQQSYETAYGDDKVPWTNRSGNEPSMLMHINFEMLPAEYQKYGEEDRIGHLLEKIIVMQKSSTRGNENIWHSDGTTVEETNFPITEFELVGQLLGIIPWATIMVIVLVIRWIVAYIWPNNVYELIFENFAHMAKLPVGMAPAALPKATVSFDKIQQHKETDQVSRYEAY